MWRSTTACFLEFDVQADSDGARLEYGRTHVQRVAAQGDLGALVGISAIVSGVLYVEPYIPTPLFHPRVQIQRRIGRQQAGISRGLNIGVLRSDVAITGVEPTAPRLNSANS